MGQKVSNKSLRHYSEMSENTSMQKEVDKTKSISQLTRKELLEMMSRVRDEVELQNLIKELKLNSGERGTFDNPIKIDTTTPINQLYHHGILGQKWGVRRYQNKDGTRTPAGKRRDSKNTPISEGQNASGMTKTKGISGLSTEELRKLNERLQLEATYKKLTTEKIAKAESWVKKAITSGGEQALTDFSKNVFLGSAKLLVKELSPQFAETAFNIREKKNG